MSTVKYIQESEPRRVKRKCRIVPLATIPSSAARFVPEDGVTSIRKQLPFVSRSTTF